MNHCRQSPLPFLPIVGLAVAFCALASPSYAQAPLDDALALAAEGQLEQALESFEQALAEGVDREDLVRLLTERALIFFALGERDKMRQDLSLLAAMEPHLDLGRRAAPPVRKAFERARDSLAGPLSVRVQTHPVTGGVRFEVQVGGLPDHIQPRVELAIRASGTPWTRVSEATFTYPVLTGGELSYYARLIGPGGAVLAEQGDAAAPRTMQVEGPRPTALATDERAPATKLPEKKRPKRLWWWVGASGAAVAAASVALALTLGGSSASGTPVGGPRVVVD